MRRITVGKIGKKGRIRGVLRQIHQDVFYDLLRLWGEQGYKVGTIDGDVYGSVTTTVYELVQAVRGDNSAHHYERVQELLRDLAGIPIVIENGYTWQGVVDREEFTLLGGLHWSEKSIDKTTRRPKPGGMSKAKVLFSPRVTEGFLHKHVKTLLAEPYQSLREGRHGRSSEIARLLYPFLDAQLATKDEYHACLAPLAARFGLRVDPHKSHRRRQFASAVKVLNGKAILNERFTLEVRLDLASDTKDFVLVARRRASSVPPGWSEAR